MRLLLLLAVTLALAYGVWTFLGDEETPHTPSGVEPAPTAEAPDTPKPPPIVTTVTLVLTVRTEAGTIPQGTLAGYSWGGEDRLRTVGATGRLTFTDAPAGPLTLVARAPGYEPIEQKRYLTAGVPSDAILILKAPRRP